MGTAASVDGRSRFIGLGHSALRRAENIAPRAGRTAIAFGDACDRRVFASTKSSTVSRSIAQFRWAVGDLGPSPHTGQPLILIPGATAAVVWEPGERVSSRLGISRTDRRSRAGPVG